LRAGKINSYADILAIAVPELLSRKQDLLALENEGIEDVQAMKTFKKANKNLLRLRFELRSSGDDLRYDDTWRSPADRNGSIGPHPDFPVWSNIYLTC